MVKLVQTDEPDAKHDNNFFFAETVALAADAPTTFWAEHAHMPVARASEPMNREICLNIGVVVADFTKLAHGSVNAIRKAARHRSP